MDFHGPWGYSWNFRFQPIFSQLPCGKIEWLRPSLSIGRGDDARRLSDVHSSRWPPFCRLCASWAPSRLPSPLFSRLYKAAGLSRRELGLLGTPWCHVCCSATSEIRGTLRLPGAPQFPSGCPDPVRTALASAVGGTYPLCRVPLSEHTQHLCLCS